MNSQEKISNTEYFDILFNKILRILSKRTVSKLTGNGNDDGHQVMTTYFG